jgi:hypothetical protein
MDHRKDFQWLVLEKPGKEDAGAKLLNRFFHRRRQVSPPVNNVTHRFFDGSQHFLYRNFTVGSCYSAVASSPVPLRL